MPKPARGIDETRAGGVYLMRFFASLSILLGVLLTGAGCEAPTGTAVGNSPPETYLSISDVEVDTTHYIVPLHWWGSDEDGEVIAYQYRWDGNWYPDPTDTLASDDSSWVQTRRTERDFVVAVEGTQASPRFFVRAIDNEGMADPTPKSQRFHVRNRLPAVAFGEDLERPTRSLPAVTFSLIATDPDGNETIAGYRVWFEGQRPEEAIIYSGRDSAWITLLPENFPGPGTQTAHIQSMDEARSFSPDTVSHTWEVLDIEGKRVLLIDQHPNDHPASWGDRIDAFYNDALASRVGSESVLCWNFETDGAFRSADEVNVAFSTFEAVFWYTGVQMNIPEITERRIAELRIATDGLVAYARGGGKVYLESTLAFGDAVQDEDTEYAAWDSVATYRLFGLKKLQLNRVGNPLGNTNFVLFPGLRLEPNTELGLDTLRTAGIMNYVDFFPLPSTALPLLWVPPGTLVVEYDGVTRNAVDYYCGFLFPFAGGGEMTVLTFPLALADANATAATVLQVVIDRYLD